MKNLPALLILLSLSSYADVLNITQIQTDPGFEIRFTLTENSPVKSYIKLDCQSFLQKLDFYNDKNQITSENFISIDECEDIYNNTIKCLDNTKKKCFNSDNIFSEKCDCI